MFMYSRDETTVNRTLSSDHTDPYVLRPPADRAETASLTPATDTGWSPQHRHSRAIARPPPPSAARCPSEDRAHTQCSRPAIPKKSTRHQRPRPLKQYINSLTHGLSTDSRPSTQKPATCGTRGPSAVSRESRPEVRSECGSDCLAG